MNMVKLSKKTSISACEQSPSALIDLIILIVVICASGFLIYPYVTILLSETVEIFEPILCMIQEEVVISVMIFSLLGLAIVTMVVLTITLCKSTKCGQPGCRGLQEAGEVDIWIEREDCVKKLNSSKDGLKKDLFELPKDYRSKLEAELKKMAPANGRVVLVFRDRCGCPVVRVEVSGSKKNNRKAKKKIRDE